MKKSCLFAFLTLFLLFPSAHDAVAGTWVEQLNGNPDAIIISRNGDLLKAEEMMRLQPGDIIKVQEEGVTMRILLGSGSVKTVSKKQSPYTVAGRSSNNSFFANLMGEVKNMLVASSSRTKAVAMASRGAGKQLDIQAVAEDENLILARTKQLHLAISCKGNECPLKPTRYGISLINLENEKTILKLAGKTGQPLVIDTGKMTDKDMDGGEYELSVESQGSSTLDKTAARLRFVNLDELEDDKVQKLLELGLEKRVEARMLISLLYEQPEWRLFTHSLAVQYGLKRKAGCFG